MLAPQHLSLGALQCPHGLQGPRQQHGGQRRGENKPSRVRANRVYQGTGAGDVASHTAKGFAWRKTEKGNWAYSFHLWEWLEVLELFHLEEWVILTARLMWSWHVPAPPANLVFTQSTVQLCF